MAKRPKVSERPVEMLGSSSTPKDVSSKIWNSYNVLYETGPKRLVNMLDRARIFYISKDAELAFWHAFRVLLDSIRHGMVEVDKVRKSRRAENNLFLATDIIYHPLRNRKKAVLPVQDVGRYEKKVGRDLDKFSELRDCDLEGGSSQRYVSILEETSLALLARMVDLLAYSDYDDRNLEAEDQLSRLDPSLFYVYDESHGSREYRRIAIAADEIYAPFADLLGYRPLAGELHEMSYKILKRDYWSEVHSAFAQHGYEIMNTQNFCQKLLEKVGEELKRKGFEFKIELRPQKHPGKVMRKIEDRGLLVKTGGDVENALLSIKDLVAFKIVLMKKGRRRATKEDWKTAEEIVKAKADELSKNKGTTISGYNTEHIKKANGYESIHVDIILGSHEYVPLEVQIKDADIERIAEHGAAAHWLYQGGNAALHKKVRHVYRDFLKALESGRASLLSRFNIPPRSNITVNVIMGGNAQEVTLSARANIADVLARAGLDLERASPKDGTNGLSLFSPAIFHQNLTVMLQKGLATRLKGDTIDSLIRECVSKEARQILMGFKKRKH